MQLYGWWGSAGKPSRCLTCTSTTAWCGSIRRYCITTVIHAPEQCHALILLSTVMYLSTKRIVIFKLHFTIKCHIQNIHQLRQILDKSVDIHYGQRLAVNLAIHTGHYIIQSISHPFHHAKMSLSVRIAKHVRTTKQPMIFCKASFLSS